MVKVATTTLGTIVYYHKMRVHNSYYLRIYFGLYHFNVRIICD